MTDIEDAFRRLMRGAEHGVVRVAKELVAATERDLPQGDPTEDPNAHIELANSVDIEVDHNPQGVTATVSYNAPYAKKQHEAQHYKHPRGGKAKFLEGQLASMEGRAANIIAEEMSKEL